MSSDEQPMDQGFSARIAVSDVHVGARFRVVSAPLDYEPTIEVQEGEAFLSDLYWSEHETRVIRYSNTGERVLLYPRLDAPVSRGDRYVVGRITSVEELGEEFVAVRCRPIEGPTQSRDDGEGAGRRDSPTVGSGR